MAELLEAFDDIVKYLVIFTLTVWATGTAFVVYIVIREIVLDRREQKKREGRCK